MYHISIKQISKKQPREDLISYTFLAEILENGEKVETVKFFGAEVLTDRVRSLTGSGLRISMLQGNAVSISATKVVGDMVDAFAAMQSGEDGIVKVANKKSEWEADIEFQEN